MTGFVVSGEDMKILATDFDGTVNYGGWPREKYEALRKWREAGNLFGLVSGRGVPDLLMLSDENALICDFLIADNGAVIAMPDGGIISEETNDFSIARKLINFLFKNPECTWASVRNAETEYFVKPGNIPLNPGDVHEDRLPEMDYFTQISTSFPDIGTVPIVIGSIKSEFGGLLNPMQNNCCIDIVKGGINKSVGIGNYAKFMGVSENDIVVAGDNANDADMIRDYRSYAVGGAIDSIKQLATYTVYDITELIYKELEGDDN